MAYVCHGSLVEVRVQLVGIQFPLLPCGAWKSKSSHQIDGAARACTCWAILLALEWYFSKYIFDVSLVCVCTCCMCVDHMLWCWCWPRACDISVEVRGQFCKVRFLSCIYEFQELNSDGQACQQVLLITEPSHWPNCIGFIVLHT